MGEVRQEPSYLAIQYLHETKKYPISKLCAALHIPRCSYYKWLKREKNRNELLNEQIIDWIKALYIAQNGILGYRQMTIAINRTHQTQFNKKRIRRLMRALNLRSVCRKKRCSYTPSTPEVTAENILNREFHADRPNSKWVTDISYIHTRQGVLYLSMIRDLYDNSIAAYKTATQQTVNLVLDTIRLAMKREKKRAAAELQLHSDQGFQYTSHAYFQLTKQYGITPSMSRRGNPYDNAMAENFFSILKTECIYRRKPATFSEANEMIDSYIHFYNHERIQLKTGEAPLARRLSA